MEKALNAIKNASSISTLTYTDAHSCDGSAYRDLELGMKHTMVGCNSVRLRPGNALPGAIVKTQAKKDGIWYFTIGVLGAHAQACTLWKDHGGEVWKYNHYYEPLTGIVEVTPEMKKYIKESAERHGLPTTTFFNSRFCSAKLRPIFEDLIQWEGFQRALLLPA
jgi:hypothetical protein